jgi:hypothetical protein
MLAARKPLAAKLLVAMLAAARKPLVAKLPVAMLAARKPLAAKLQTPTTAGIP